MIEGIPIGFIMMMLGIFAVAVVITLVAFFVKQRRLSRMKNPYRDYMKK